MPLHPIGRNFAEERVLNAVGVFGLGVIADNLINIALSTAPTP